MADDDVDVLTDNPSSVDKSPRVWAAERAEQLAQLRAALAAGRLISDDDVAAAYRRLEEAHIRAHRAHVSAAEQHRRAARAHEQAAESHAAAADKGNGDVEAHRRAAAIHDAASDEEYRNAEKALALAEREADYARSTSSKTP